MCQDACSSVISIFVFSVIINIHQNLLLLEIRKMQQLARRHSEKIIDENQNLRSELELKMSELNARSKELDDLASKSSHDKSNLEQEKQKVCDFLALHLIYFAPSLNLLK